MLLNINRAALATRSQILQGSPILHATHLWLGSQVGHQTSIIVICIGSFVPPIILLFQSNVFFYLERIHNVMYIQKCKHCNTTENNSTLYQIICLSSGVYILWKRSVCGVVGGWGIGIVHAAKSIDSLKISNYQLSQ